MWCFFLNWPSTQQSDSSQTCMSAHSIIYMLTMERLIKVLDARVGAQLYFVDACIQPSLISSRHLNFMSGPYNTACTDYFGTMWEPDHMPNPESLP